MNSGRLGDFIAMAVPTDELMPEVFDSEALTTDSRLPGVTFEPIRDNDALLPNMTCRETTQPATKSKNAVAHGVNGVADEVFFTWQGDSLRELPLGWLHSHDCWGSAVFRRGRHR